MPLSESVFALLFFNHGRPRLQRRPPPVESPPSSRATRIRTISSDTRQESEETSVHDMSSEISLAEEVNMASDIDPNLSISRDTSNMPPPPPRVPVAQQESVNLQQSPQESDTDKLEGSGNGQMSAEIGAKLAQATL